MAKRFVRNLLVAVGVFLIMVILVQTNVKFAEPITEYVSFVVATDFSVQPFVEKVGFLQKLANWDLGAWFDSWTQASSGW